MTADGSFDVERSAMPKYSAGLLPFRLVSVGEKRWVEVFIVHPGGPFWAKKDNGAWSIVKGEYDPEIESDPTQVAMREFREETGQDSPTGDWLPLRELKQPSGKRVVAWAVSGDVDASAVVSNSFEMEWPPKSGSKQLFPEVDRGAWFPVGTARSKILKGQTAFLDALMASISTISGPGFEEIGDAIERDPMNGPTPLF